jgi:hypothetical protein
MSQGLGAGEGVLGHGGYTSGFAVLQKAFKTLSPGADLKPVSEPFAVRFRVRLIQSLAPRASGPLDDGWLWLPFRCHLSQM